MANYDSAWDETTPAGSEARSLGDDRIREMKAQIRARLATEHSSITDESGDYELIHKAGQCTIMYVGTTAAIAALTNAFATANLCCLAFDTDIGALKYFNGTEWTVVPFDWDGMWGAGDAVHTHESDAEGGIIVGSRWKELSTYVQVASLSAVQNYTDVDVSSYDGTDTAKWAILVANMNFSSGAAGEAIMMATFRKNGSTETSYCPRIIGSAYYSTAICRVTQQLIVPLDASQVFELKWETVSGTPASFALTVNMIGYIV